jgi:outer membrane protein TolC
MATYLEVITAQNNKLQNDLEVINVTLERLNAGGSLQSPWRWCIK